MSRRKQETVVLRVTVDAPIGATIDKVEKFVRDALATAIQTDCLDRLNPTLTLVHENVRVSLLERHVRYYTKPDKS